MVRERSCVCVQGNGIRAGQWGKGHCWVVLLQAESPLRWGQAHPSAEVLLPSVVQQVNAPMGAGSSTGALPCLVGSVA